MRKTVSLGSMALMALAVAACGGDVPTSPQTSAVEPQLSRGQAMRDLGQAVSHGWTCVAIPALGVHCFPPGAFKSNPSISVLVYDTDDPADMDAEFLGSELLIRADLYGGQPCPAEGGEYALLEAADSGLPADYRACHHYAHDD